MNRIIFSVFAVVVLVVGRGLAAENSKVKSDPVVGLWIWQASGNVTVKANGTVADKSGWQGKWKFHAKDAEGRTYLFQWTAPDQRLVVDTLRLSTDGKKLEGKNSEGESVTAMRPPL